jgi:hypothetical protein
MLVFRLRASLLLPAVCPCAYRGGSLYLFSVDSHIELDRSSHSSQFILTLSLYINFRSCRYRGIEQSSILISDTSTLDHVSILGFLKTIPQTNIRSPACNFKVPSSADKCPHCFQLEPRICVAVPRMRFPPAVRSILSSRFQGH